MGYLKIYGFKIKDFDNIAEDLSKLFIITSYLFSFKLITTETKLKPKVFPASYHN